MSRRKQLTLWLIVGLLGCWLGVAGVVLLDVGWSSLFVVGGVLAAGLAIRLRSSHKR